MRSFATMCRLTGRVHHNPRPLGTINNTAHAWRQTVFYLSLRRTDQQRRTLDGITEACAQQPWHIVGRLTSAPGLRQFLSGGQADDGAGRRLLGWSTGGHWLREEPAPGPPAHRAARRQ